MKNVILLDDYNQRVPTDQSVMGGVTTQFGNPAPRHGWKLIEYEPVQVDDSAGDGPGICDVPAEVGVRPELSCQQVSPWACARGG